MAPVASRPSVLPSPSLAGKRRTPRDLLPIPNLPSAKIHLLGSSRSSHQKVARHVAAVASANETIWALNFLYGGSGPSCPGLSAAQRSTHSNLLAAASVDPPPNSETPEAAFRRLLGARADGYSDGSLDGTAPFDQSRLSWPGSAGNCSLESCLLASEVAPIINVDELLLFNSESLKERISREGQAKPYWDPLLRGGSPAYIALVKELLARKMVCLKSSCRARAGLFCVEKKNGRLRFIVDARVCNQLFKRPPSTHLASTAAVVELEVDDGGSVFFAAQDVADCYYQFRIPSELSGFFGLQDISAGDLGVSEVDGQPVDPSFMVTPCFCVLPMGFSWALHWTQQAHRELLARGGLGGVERELLDKAPAPSLSSDVVPRVLYVDNQVFFSSRSGGAEPERQRAAKILDHADLPYHDVVTETSLVDCIGLE